MNKKSKFLILCFSADPHFADLKKQTVYFATVLFRRRYRSSVAVIQNDYS